MSEPQSAPVAGPERPPLGESLRLVATLAVAGLLSGFAIVSAYRLTLPLIQANQAAALRRAVFEVLPGTERMERLVWDGSALVAAAEGQGASEDSVYAGYAADGALVGYAVPAAGPGFQDTIKLLFGLAPGAETAIGMTVLESRETPGLGDRIYKDPEFVAEFARLVVVPVIELVKGHGEGANQVDAITGATISSKAVVRIVNGAVAVWQPRLAGAGGGALAPGPASAAADGLVPPDVTRGGPVPGGKPGGEG